MRRTQMGPPIEWRLLRMPSAAGTVWRAGKTTAVVSKDDGRWHVSVSHPDRYPTWDELASAKDRFVPDDATMVMVFPPRAEYVNLHETTLHLWEQ